MFSNVLSVVLCVQSSISAGPSSRKSSSASKKQSKTTILEEDSAKKKRVLAPLTGKRPGEDLKTPASKKPKLSGTAKRRLSFSSDVKSGEEEVVEEEEESLSAEGNALKLWKAAEDKLQLAEVKLESALKLIEEGRVKNAAQAELITKLSISTGKLEEEVKGLNKLVDEKAKTIELLREIMEINKSKKL